jgi:hypothetical protein
MQCIQKRLMPFLNGIKKIQRRQFFQKEFQTALQLEFPTPQNSPKMSDVMHEMLQMRQSDMCTAAEFIVLSAICFIVVSTRCFMLSRTGRNGDVETKQVDARGDVSNELPPFAGKTRNDTSNNSTTQQWLPMERPLRTSMLCRIKLHS